MAIYPLDSPVEIDGHITVDLMLREPKRINKRISKIASNDLFATTLFTPDVAIGGAIIFDKVGRDEATVEGVAQVPAGGEFPTVSTSDESDAEVKRVVKTGGKFRVTDEAVKRNDQALVQRESRKLGNKIQHDVNLGALEALDEAMLELGSDALSTVSGGWVAAGATTAAQKTAVKSIRADILRAKAEGKKTGLGYIYNVLAMSVEDDLALRIALEDDAVVASFFASHGLTPVVSEDITVGTSKLIAGGSVGVMGIEDPLTTEAIADRLKQSTWVQSHMSALFAVTDPFAIVDITNVNGSA